MVTLPSRRAVLIGCLAAPYVARCGTAWGASAVADPFSLGVASGDPLDTSVVLWTRLAPDPVGPDGGMPREAREVVCEVYRDEALRQPFRTLTATAEPDAGHSVHLNLQGLEPDRRYWYRFGVNGVWSTVGRTRTLPAPDAPVARLRLATAGCQKIQDGHYCGWAEIAAGDYDLVFHYGDYIYERRLSEAIDARVGRAVTRESRRRPRTLEEYRRRYALYKLDPDLQAAHAAHPFLPSYDDHEVLNDWAGEEAPTLARGAFLVRRAAALRAFYENMPLRSLSQAFTAASYRALRYGRLAQLTVLNTRLFRSGWACGTSGRANCPERLEPSRSIIGMPQEAWLHGRLQRSETPWNVVCQQVPVMELKSVDEEGDENWSMDKWDGYPASRDRMLDAVAEARTSGFVVLTGDLHSAVAGELRKDFSDVSQPPVGVEFVASSMSTRGGRIGSRKKARKILSENPSAKLFNGRRGYVDCLFEAGEMRVRYQAFDSIEERGATSSTLKEFVVDPRNPRL